MQSQELLTTAIHALPVPGSPPKLSRASAWVGLSFLETALRQNHVRRIGETLQLTEHRVSTRVVELDVSLNLLDDVQSDAGLAYSHIRQRRAHSAPVNAEDQLLWVPVARLSKRSVSPVDVYDAHGIVVPRLTQFDSSRLLASGMYKLLRSILVAEPAATEPGHDLNRLLTATDASRWLLQSAMLTLFTERASPTSPTLAAAPSDGGQQGPLSEQRCLAARVLADNAGVLRDYYRLLDVALEEYLIVVGLPNSKAEHHLRYMVPLQAAGRPQRGAAASLVRQLKPGFRGYRVLYTATVPASVSSYHLVAETDTSLLVKKLVMSCDADHDATAILAADLSDLAGRLLDRRDVPNPAPDKILELELETAVRTLSELMRRRAWEAQQAGGEIHPAHTKAAQILAAAGISGHAYQSRDGMYRTSLLVNPWVTPELLKQASEELKSSNVELALTHQDDPVTNRAIAYWRHHGVIDPGADSYQITSSVLITDAGNASRNVSWFALGVILVTYVVGASTFGWNLRGTARPLPTPAATIAVLLLVPGYLYSRLDNPRWTSISARLRFLPRMTAYFCIGSVVLLAAFITGNAKTADLRPGFCAALVVQVLFVVFLLLKQQLPGWRFHTWEREVVDAAPRWFHISKRTVAPPPPPLGDYDVHFYSQK